MSEVTVETTETTKVWGTDQHTVITYTRGRPRTFVITRNSAGIHIYGDTESVPGNVIDVVIAELTAMRAKEKTRTYKLNFVVTARTSAIVRQALDYVIENYDDAMKLDSVERRFLDTFHAAAALSFSVTSDEAESLIAALECYIHEDKSDDVTVKTQFVRLIRAQMAEQDTV